MELGLDKLGGNMITALIILLSVVATGLAIIVCVWLGEKIINWVNGR